jgi:transcription elongation factor Elf1
VATRVERRRYKYLKATSKKMVFGPFECPSCGADIFFRLDKDRNKIIIRCQCGLTGEWDPSPTLQPIDYYSKLMESRNQHKQ